jgi:hypothetical protein
LKALAASVTVDSRGGVKVRGIKAATQNVMYLRLNRGLFALCLIAASFYIIGSQQTTGAAESHALLTVGATVLPVAKVLSASAPSEIIVSAADVRRGYVDVSQPTALEVNSNSPNGIALDLMTLSPMMTSVIVSGLDSEQSLGADGGTIVQRWQHPQSIRLSLRFKLMLAPGIAPGRYAWPLRLDVRPL